MKRTAKKGQWGGPRPGSGRPRKPRATKVISAARQALVKELDEAKTGRALFRFDKSLGSAQLRGDLKPREVDSLLGASREARQALKIARAERAEKKVRALEVLTPDEYDALQAYRASVRPAPVKPGEYVEPPVIDERPT